MDCSQQAPLSMRFPKQECWNGFPCPPPGDLPGPGIELHLLHLLHWQADSSLLGPPESGEKLNSISFKIRNETKMPTLATLFQHSIGYSRRRQWHPTPVLLPGKSHGWRSLVGCSPWGCKESEMAEQLHFHFSLSCVREGNGNPLQCSCHENPRDSGASWAAVYGVAQSWTQLTWLSSSSSNTGYSRQIN